jgi:hypothetical protein
VSSTAADRREFLESGLVELDCARCAARVRVRKASAAQTSVQWTAQAQRRCPAFDPRTGCPDLRASIDGAVREGRLPVS